MSAEFCKQYFLCSSTKKSHKVKSGDHRIYPYLPNHLSWKTLLRYSITIREWGWRTILPPHFLSSSKINLLKARAIFSARKKNKVSPFKHFIIWINQIHLKFCTKCLNSNDVVDYQHVESSEDCMWTNNDSYACPFLRNEASSLKRTYWKKFESFLIIRNAQRQNCLLSFISFSLSFLG